MSKENFNNIPKTRYESLCDLNLLSLLSQCGSDWSSTIKEEIQASTNQPIEKEEPSLTNKVVLFCFLTALALLGVAAWIQAQKIYQSVQEVGRSSVEQLILAASANSEF
jgi:hypothetical protein